MHEGGGAGRMVQNSVHWVLKNVYWLMWHKVA